MSVRVMTMVWDHFPGAGSELLAMLAMADWCNDEGGSLHPSIGGVADKIRTSESQARRIVHQLIEDGWLSVVGNENGGAPGTSRHYVMDIGKLRELPAVRPSRPSTSARGRIDARGSTGARDGSHGCAQTGRTHDTRTINITTIEPSDTPVVPEGDQGSLLKAEEAEPAKPNPLEVIRLTYNRMLGTRKGCLASRATTAKLLRKLRAADSNARRTCRDAGVIFEPEEFWEVYFGVCLEDPWKAGDVPNPKNPRWRQNLGTLIDDQRFAEVVDVALAQMGGDE